MTITSKSQYALKTLVDLATRREGDVATVADIARRQGIPPQFLEQILLLLKRGGMVRSRRGRLGGYSLSRKGLQATLADVLALTDDALMARPEAGEGADGTERAIGRRMREVNDRFLQLLHEVTVRDLRDEAEPVPATNYSI